MPIPAVKEIESYMQRTPLSLGKRVLLEAIYHFGCRLEQTGKVDAEHTTLLAILSQAVHADAADLTHGKVLLLRMMLMRATELVAIPNSSSLRFERAKLYPAIQQAVVCHALPEMLLSRLIASAMSPLQDWNEPTKRIYYVAVHYYELPRERYVDEIKRPIFALAIATLCFRAACRDPLYQALSAFVALLMGGLFLASSRLVDQHIDRELAKRLKHLQDDTSYTALSADYLSPEQLVTAFVSGSLQRSSSHQITAALRSESPSVGANPLTATSSRDFYNRSPSPEPEPATPDEGENTNDDEPEQDFLPAPTPRP